MANNIAGINVGFRYSGRNTTVGNTIRMLLHRLLTTVICLFAPLSFAAEYGNDPRDPWEGLNRHIFAFNEGADRYVAKPVAKAYKEVTPRFIDQGLPRESEDFGQTLAVWGVEPGPFLMLPLLGPSTIRDGSSLFIDRYASPTSEVEPFSAELGLMALDLVQVRAKLLGSDELVSGDKYTFLKDAYLQRRQFLINDGEFQDSFGDEDFESFDFE